jgi:hypothetical protein
MLTEAYRRILPNDRVRLVERPHGNKEEEPAIPRIAHAAPWTFSSRSHSSSQCPQIYGGKFSLKDEPGCGVHPQVPGDNINPTIFAAR